MTNHTKQHTQTLPFPITLNSLTEIIDTLNTAYQKDFEKAEISIAFDLRKHLIQQDETNEILVDLKINQQLYHCVYTNFNLFQKDLQVLKDTEKELEKELDLSALKITYACADNLQLKLINRNFAKIAVEPFNYGLEDALYPNFLTWYKTNLKKQNFSLSQVNTKLFANKNLSVNIDVKLEDSAIKQSEVWKREPVASDSEAVHLMNAFKSQNLTVYLTLSNGVSLVYVLNLFNADFYDDKTHNILVDEQTMISYYCNLINNFYTQINNALSNKQLDFLLQIIKYNKNFKYTPSNNDTATYRINLDNTKKTSLIFTKKFFVINNHLFTRDFDYHKNLKNTLPIYFYYDAKTNTFTDDGISFIVYNNLNENNTINHLKYEYKTLNEWQIWYENINRTSTNFKNFKDALKQFNDFSNEHIIDLDSIPYYCSINNKSNLHFAITLNDDVLAKLKTDNHFWSEFTCEDDKDIIWINKKRNQLLVGCNYLNNTQITKIYDALSNYLINHQPKKQEEVKTNLHHK